MEFYFNENDTFVWSGEQWTIVHIDGFDDEYPYECYPTEIVNKAKQIIENGGIVDDDQDFVYDNYMDVLNDVYIDDRQCLSEVWIFEIVHEALKKEIEQLKAEIKMLKGEI